MAFVSTFLVLIAVIAVIFSSAAAAVMDNKEVLKTMRADVTGFLEKTIFANPQEAIANYHKYAQENNATASKEPTGMKAGLGYDYSTVLIATKNMYMGGNPDGCTDRNPSHAYANYLATCRPSTDPNFVSYYVHCTQSTQSITIETYYFGKEGCSGSYVQGLQYISPCQNGYGLSCYNHEKWWNIYGYSGMYEANYPSETCNYLASDALLTIDTCINVSLDPTTSKTRSIRNTAQVDSGLHSEYDTSYCLKEPAYSLTTNYVYCQPGSDNMQTSICSTADMTKCGFVY